MAKKSSFRVRFRHGVYPNLESQATREDIKKYDYFFGSEQTWVQTPGKVDFVNDPIQNGSGGEGVDSPIFVGGRKTTTRRVNRSRSTRIRHDSALRLRSIQGDNLRATGDYFDDGIEDSTPTGPDVYWPSRIVVNGFPYKNSGPESVSSLDDIVPSSWQDELPSQLVCDSIKIEHPLAWPLADPIEGRLLRFWVDEAARWWDSTSSNRIFRQVVPALAMQNSMLLNAILMYSAQHIQRFHINFPANPYFYHERLLQHLIPHLAEKGRIEDDATLFAAMLLRAFEEFQAGTQEQMHLSTYELFQGPGGWLFDMSNPLVQACLMMHVRFDIDHALLNRPSLHIDYSEDILDIPTSQSDNACWENRIIWLTARILQWIGKKTCSVSEWHELRALVHEWESTSPKSFNALSHDRNPENPRDSPGLWISGPCHAAANVYLQICHMALVTHVPAGNYGGIFVSNPVLNVRYEILKGLKEMIASARCDAYAVSTTSVAVRAIHRFAVILSDDCDWQKIVEFLEEVDATGCWPTKSSISWVWQQWRQLT